MRGARLLVMASVALPGCLVVAEALAWTAGVPALPAVERVTGPWCHRDPERTLIVADALLPVCARCTGLYLGLVVGPLLGVLLPREGRGVGRAAALALVPAIVGGIAALLEAAGVVSTGNTTRVWLGLALTVGPLALGVMGARILGDVLEGAARPTP